MRNTPRLRRNQHCKLNMQEQQVGFLDMAHQEKRETDNDRGFPYHLRRMHKSQVFAHHRKQEFVSSLHSLLDAQRLKLRDTPAVRGSAMPTVLVGSARTSGAQPGA